MAYGPCHSADLKPERGCFGTDTQKQWMSPLLNIYLLGIIFLIMTQETFVLMIWSELNFARNTLIADTVIEMKPDCKL